MGATSVLAVLSRLDRAASGAETTENWPRYQFCSCRFDPRQTGLRWGGPNRRDGNAELVIQGRLPAAGTLQVSAHFFRDGCRQGSPASCVIPLDVDIVRCR